MIFGKGRPKNRRNKLCFNLALRAARFSALSVILIGIGYHAGPAPDSGFLEHPEQLDDRPGYTPFNAFWMKPGVKMTEFDVVLVAPVDTTHLEKMDWWGSASLAGSTGDFAPDREARALADSLERSLKERLRGRKHGTQLSDTPRGRAARLELAIVEVVPTKVWLNTIGYVFSGALDHGSTAIEGRVRDLESNETVAAWKDRQTGQFALVSAADLSWYAHAEKAVAYWAEMHGDLFHESLEKFGEGRSPVTLRPW